MRRSYPAIFIVVIGVLLVSCSGLFSDDSDDPADLAPSTIVFADGNAVTKIVGPAPYTNGVSGDGSGAVTYASGTPATATVAASTGAVSLVAAGTTVITANKAATGTHAAASATYTLTVLGIGSEYGGGKIAYILTSGDPGYVAGQSHGLIAAASDQHTGTGVKWAGIAYENVFVPSGTSTALGTGSANTDAIIAQTGSLYAAGKARAYGGGGYSDWYLPSRDELIKLYLNREALGGFLADGGSRYWSSSETIYATLAYALNFLPSAYDPEGLNAKSQVGCVRAVRTF